ncbi:unnamed protein product [Owenia fusiformis]|uniref:Major facilitator superfamily (MFS) profile domain-containing protein n=1 Tax=Owenia fusiformis TaxID=6347 RepID=A0A8S4N3E4_OWEFU|nr:unnamed protein product [Owenia fusiformis]
MASFGSMTWSGSQLALGSQQSLNKLQSRSRLDKAGLSPEEEEQIDEELKRKGHVTLPLCVTAFAAAFGSSFTHGWNTGVMNPPSEYIKDFINSTYTVNYGGEPSEIMLTFIWSFSLSIYLIGGMIGAFSAGTFADKFGRRNSLLILHAPAFVATLLFFFSKMAGSFVMVILARFIVGFACGCGSGLVPMYLTEIAPLKIRGAMGVLHQLALTTGILCSQAIGIYQILGNDAGWHILLALTGAPCVFSCIVLPFFPDSPRYLLLIKKNEEAAKKSLQRFRGTDDVRADILEMKNEQKQALAEPNWSMMKLFKAKHLRMPLAVVCSLALGQQLSGINVVFYYSNGVFAGAGIPENMIQYAILGTGGINVLMTIISVPLMERCGRRPLLLVGMGLMTVSASLITVALLLQDSVPAMAYVSIACMHTFVIGFAIGLGSIPQFIGSELFRQGPRPAAMSFAGLLNWLANTSVGIGYPFIEKGIGPYSFLIFIGMLVGFGIFIFKFCPETKNKTFDEIARIFSIENFDLDDEAHPLGNLKNGHKTGSAASYTRVPSTGDDGKLLNSEDIDFTVRTPYGGSGGDAGPVNKQLLRVTSET